VLDRKMILKSNLKNVLAFDLKEILIISSFMSLLASCILSNIWIVVIVFTIFILFIGLKSNYKNQLFILSFLVLTSDINESLRIIINVISILYLFFIFIKQYGLDVIKYPKPPRLFIQFISFTLFAFTISSLTSLNIFLSLTEVLRQSIFFVIVYFFYTVMIIERDMIKYFVRVLIISSIIISLIIIYYFAFSDTAKYILITTGVIQEGGYLNNVAAAGGIILVGISLSMVQVLSLNKMTTIIKYLGIVCLFIQVIALLLTNSRAAILGTIISSLFIIYKLREKLFKKVLLVLVLSSVFLFAFYPDIVNIIFVFFRSERVFSNTRYLMWEIAYDIIKNNPVFGVGPGMFKFYIYKYLPVNIGSWEEHQLRWLYDYSDLGHAHNFILFLTSESGILGFIIAIALPLLFFFYSKKTLKLYENNYNVYSLIIGILGLGIGLFVRSFFESTGILSYGWITRDLPFWIVFIIVIYLYQESKSLSTNEV
jgi:O-antigen ligase